jgi:tetratricopeptide (TPR) repeat protein
VAHHSCSTAEAHDTDILGNPVTAADPRTLRGSTTSSAASCLSGNRPERPPAAERTRPLPRQRLCRHGLDVSSKRRGPHRAAPFVGPALPAADATPREAMNARMAAAWAADDIPGAIALCEEIARAHPRDLVSIKIGQYHLFNRGDSPGMLRMALHALPACEDMAYLHGMIAFGYEQCHLMAEAEEAARRALEIEPTDPWAHHALAHVMLTKGRIDEGIAFLEGVSPTWAGLNSFMRSHNWWHLTLFYISRGRVADALRSYDQNIWGSPRPTARTRWARPRSWRGWSLRGSTSATAGPTWPTMSPGAERTR